MKTDKSPKTAGGIVGEGVPGKSSKKDSAKPALGVSAEPSGLPSQLQASEGRISSGEVVDAARVSNIKQAISEGHFNVNSDVVADRLLQTVRELIIRHKQ